VAQVRQARGTAYPDPVLAAYLAQGAGADQITVHLREDRRHIQERDLEILRRTVTVPLNLEMAPTDEMVAIALTMGVDMVTLVPEKREERTTEGGLDVNGLQDRLKNVIAKLKSGGIGVSLFINPEPADVKLSADLGVDQVEIHTGFFADTTGARQEAEFDRIADAAHAGIHAGVRVAAGHGLDYRNVFPILGLDEIEEVNIGHSIVARAIFVGFEEAVREMAEICRSYAR
jgi:pyridoxine 5-phosphate synthase